METPIELLKQKLSTLRFLSGGRGFSKLKKEAFKMIPVYETAIKQLETEQSCMRCFYDENDVLCKECTRIDKNKTI